MKTSKTVVNVYGVRVEYITYVPYSIIFLFTRTKYSQIQSMCILIILFNIH